jgi:hypothetical protein
LFNVRAFTVYCQLRPHVEKLPHSLPCQRCACEAVANIRLLGERDEVDAGTIERRPYSPTCGLQMRQIGYCEHGRDG